VVERTSVLVLNEIVEEREVLDCCGADCPVKEVIEKIYAFAVGELSE
jgi:hypothetical protein